MLNCLRCVELLNVFDVFIPQLLRYPNPSDPLNGEAASLLMKDVDSYNCKVKGAMDSFALRESGADSCWSRIREELRVPAN